MKLQKVLGTLILLVVILGLVACQSGGVTNAEPNPPLPEPTLTKVPPLWPSPTPTLYTYLNVPLDYPTIQDAIDAAQDGDQVVVSPGSYNENIDFKGKNITVRSTDPEDLEVVASTIIDGGSKGSVVIFQNGEANEARLAGFTINNGSGSEIAIYDGEAVIIAGGGILISGGAFPTIDGNRISRNQSQAGGGIAIFSGTSPLIVGNTIDNNEGDFGGGGIIVGENSSPIIQGNTINNNAGEYGGGIDVIADSSVQIEGNSFSGNQAVYGGAILIQSSSATIEENSLSDNQAKYYGGAISVGVNASSTIKANTIDGNTSGDYGGGVYVAQESTVTLTENTFSNNESWSGGAIRVESDSILVLNDPDDNAYQNNEPDDVYYWGGTDEEEAENEGPDLADFEGLDMIGFDFGFDVANINQMIANLLANDSLDPCPEVREVLSVSGSGWINPTYLVYISAAPEDFFLVVIHTTNSDMEPYGYATFGTILEGENGNVIVSVEYPVPEGQTAPNEFEIQVVVPGCEIFTETVSYGDTSTSIEELDPIEEKTLLFEDLFNRSLDPEWALIRLNDGQWNVTEQTGVLKIYLAPTTQSPDSLLLRWITEEDFEIITRVLFEPKRNFQRAGIVIYENRDNFVAVVRAYTDWDGGLGNGIFIDHASPSALTWEDPNFENYETQISSHDDVYLKLRREQDVYTGYYSLDGESWIKIGELISQIEPVSHGLLIGKSDTEIFALFDFYELHSLE